MTHRIVAATLILSLAACSMGSGTMLKPSQVGDTSLVAATADLRFIVARPKSAAFADSASTPVATGSRETTSDLRYNVCAEPSPDVAKAISNALSANASATASGIAALGPTASLSVAEGVATTQNTAIAEVGRRLATTQVLRDGVYRLCEAFANGAISKFEYSLALSRYGDTMVTLLAIEGVSGMSAAQTAASAAPIASATAPALPAGVVPKAPAAAAPASVSAAVTAPAIGDAAFLHKIVYERTSVQRVKVAAPAKPKATPAPAVNPPATKPPTAASTPDTTQAGIANAIVKLQENYLDQSRFAPLILLCTAVLTDSSEVNGGPRAAANPPASLRDVCLQSLPGIIQHLGSPAPGKAG